MLGSAKLAKPCQQDTSSTQPGHPVVNVLHHIGRLLVWFGMPQLKKNVTSLVSKLESCQNQVQFQNLAKDKASKESVHITRTWFIMLLTMSADSTPADLESSVSVSLHVLCQLVMLQLCWSKITTGRHM